MRRPAGAGIGDAGAESMKKRPAGAGIDAIVPVDDQDGASRDRNNWGFLMRDKSSLDPRVLKMLEGANRRETAAVVNNAVCRNKNGGWEFNLNNTPIFVLH